MALAPLNKETGVCVLCAKDVAMTEAAGLLAESSKEDVSYIFWCHPECLKRAASPDYGLPADLA